jgi:hypothetical protein
MPAEFVSVVDAVRCTVDIAQHATPVWSMIWA